MPLEQAAVAAIMARTHGAATRLLGISRTEDFQALIVPGDAKLRRCSELRERRIGLPSMQLQSGSPRVDALRAAIAALATAGLYHRHVDWADLPPAETMALTLPTAYAAETTALQNGSVDAVYVRGPAGLEAARAVGARVLINIGAHRDPWVRVHTALLRVVTVSETLLREHPDVIAQELLQRWPLLPARTSLDEPALGALETLKTFMVRWAFVREDFNLSSWADCQLPRRVASLVV
jgi:ABC-type nitrate/sulfonate/bicarbonate transport system substrate-binding protein